MKIESRMKAFLVLIISWASFSCFAASGTQTNFTAVNCGHAVPMTNPNFCQSFKAIAYCHCAVEHGMPPSTCNSMPRIKQILEATYGSLWNACSPRVQKDVPQQECYDNWNYYNAHCG
jgi:hypothetical protein